MGNEFVKLGVALAVIVIFVVLLRRAASKSAKSQAHGVRERLSGEDKPASGRARAAAEKAKQAAAKAAPAAKREDEDEDEGEAHDEDRDEAADVGSAEDGDDEGADASADSTTADANRAVLAQGLAKTRGGFVAKLGKLFGKKKIDANILDELEGVLFSADIGPKTANKLFQAIKGGLSKDQLGDPNAVWAKIRNETQAILEVDQAPLTFEGKTPFVVLVVGVNGVGKTTTIGKVAAKLVRDGKKVVLGAGDTFRAAAVEQLEIWGERAGVEVVRGKSGGDPSSVIFDAIRRGVDADADVVICDTAGRLHTKTDLMDELKKVSRVCDKAVSGAPHETILVLDATTGQNAIQQAQLFKEAVEVTGLVLTKLDGTAKGGVILGICDEMQVPVRYIGIGEGVDDLRPFVAQDFVDALFAGGAEADDGSAA